MRVESGLSLQAEVGWERATVRAARLLAACQDQPFLATSPPVLAEQVARWHAAFPLVQPSATATGHLHQLGVAATFTSRAELAALVEEGVDLSTATFANSTKLGSHLRAAQAAGVGRVYADSTEELAKIKKNHPTARVLVEVGAGRDSLSSGGGAAAGEVAAILEEARRLGLQVVGLALGLACTGVQEELEGLVEALATAKRLVEAAEVEGHLLSELHLGRLCLGGALPSLTYTKGVHAALATVADMALQADATHWLVAPTATLAVKVIAVRTRRDDKLPVQYYINEGVFGAFSSVLAGEAVAMPLPLGGGRNRPGLSARQELAQILGPSGDELDMVAEEVVLPRLREGDWLLFPCMGCAPMAAFGREQRVQGGQGGLRLRTAAEEVEGVLPVELAWAASTIQCSITVVQGEAGEGGEDREGACAGAKELGELELGKTLFWEDCYNL